MKRQFFIAILFIFVVSITKSNAQDNCGGATPIVCGAVVNGNTTPFAADAAPTCGTTNGTGGGLWYS
ncbi:MAG: hypothetical protein ACI9J3_002806, partial [Parvicellaceae bacterium]